MQKPKTFILILFIFSLITPNTSRNIFEGLRKILPEFFPLLEKQAQVQKEGGTLPTEESTAIVNIMLLGNALLNSNKPVGKGGYGSVFKVNGRSYQDPEQKKDLAMKVSLFNNDISDDDGLKEQSILTTDIVTYKELEGFDSKGLYFPQLYDAFDATQFFKALYSKSSASEEAKKYLDPSEDDSLDVAVMVMEFLDESLYQYLRQVKYRQVESFFHTRLRLLLNVANGLILISKDYTHCDIKPENLMLKKISFEESMALVEQGLSPLELFPGEYFQIKIIDFGLAVKGRKRTRRCEGGTPNFLPLEYYHSDLSHMNFDVFSLAMVMIDFELGEVGLREFSFINGYYIKKEKTQAEEFTDEELYSIRTQKFYLLVAALWKDEKYQPLLMEKMEEMFEGFGKIVSDTLKDRDPKSFELKDFAFLNHTVFYDFMLSGLSVFWNHYYLDHQLEEKNGPYLEEISMCDSFTDGLEKDSEDYLRTRELKQYYNNMVELNRINAENRVKFNNMLINIVSEQRPKKRLSLKNFANETEKILNDSLEKTGDKIDQIFAIRRLYKMRLIDELEIPEVSLTTLNKQKSQETGITNKKLILKLLV